jgi:hypothetical protein
VIGRAGIRPEGASGVKNGRRRKIQ